ncbi:MAG: hypothetical protein U1C19_01330 [Methanobacteriaceae archaeon]|nr:hypothetical protein [Methanobacteriaceae archaeon]
MVDNIYFKLSDGEKAVLKRGISPAVGDTILIHTDENENFITHGKSSISVGDEVIVFLDENNQYCGVKSGREFDSCVFVTNAIGRSVNYKGEILNLGTFNFNWNGTDRVYLLESCMHDLSNKGYADDKISAETIHGNVDRQYADNSSFISSKPPLELTSILVPGGNQVTVKIIDVWGNSIGCLPLYIVSIPVD